MLCPGGADSVTPFTVTDQLFAMLGSPDSVNVIVYGASSNTGISVIGPFIVIVIGLLVPL